MNKRHISQSKTEENEIVGSAYKDLKALVKAYARQDINVLFTGETGSGKEMFARLYMDSNNRSGQRMSFSCASVTKGTMTSDIFGHERGAFTDAAVTRLGLYRSCDKGILFLDELGDADPEFQAMVLRVAEGNSFFKVGSDKEEKADTLIIAATNKPGNIREDLKQRFVVLPVPPLQKHDIPALARHFLRRGLKRTVLDELMQREYVGNVRGLKACCNTLHIERGDQIFSARDESSFPESPPFDYTRFRREMEIWGRYIEPLLKKYKLTFEYLWLRESRVSAPPQEIVTLLFGEGLNENSILTYEKTEKFTRTELNDFCNAETKRSAGYYIPGLLKLIDLLNVGIEQSEKGNDFILAFSMGLKRVFETQSLPYFLHSISRIWGHEAGNFSYPPLLDLLDLPYVEAKREFRSRYTAFNRDRAKSPAEYRKITGIKADRSMRCRQKKIVKTAKP